MTGDAGTPLTAKWQIIELTKPRASDRSRLKTVSLMNEGMPGGEHRITLNNVPSMTEAARLVGWALREVERVDGPSLRASGTGFYASFIIGGQIKDRHMRLFLVYAQGNFIQTMRKRRTCRSVSTDMANRSSTASSTTTHR